MFITHNNRRINLGMVLEYYPNNTPSIIGIELKRESCSTRMSFKTTEERDQMMRRLDNCLGAQDV